MSDPEICYYLTNHCCGTTCDLSDCVHPAVVDTIRSLIFICVSINGCSLMAEVPADEPEIDGSFATVTFIGNIG